MSSPFPPAGQSFLSLDGVERVVDRKVAEQDRFCSVKLQSMDDSITDLKLLVEKQTQTITDLVTGVAVLKQRWQFFAVLGSVLGAIGTIVGLAGGLVALFSH